MTSNEFIQNLITDSTPYKLTKEDEKTIQFEGVEKYIYQKLNNNKYKASRTTPDYDTTVKEKISYCVKSNIPIHLDLSTGATKNPRLPTSPGIDWAEVFSIALLRDYLKPVAAGYKHGVDLDFFSVAVFENKVNFIPQEDVDLYDIQFSHLVELFSQYFPENLKLGYSRLADRGDREKILGAVEDDIKKRKNTWQSLDESVRNDKLAKAERNIKWVGNEQNREEMILLSALGHDSFVKECWAPYAKPIWHEEDDISLGYRNTDGWAIHVRSAQASTVNFWAGIGVLQKKDNEHLTNILSPSQYENLKSQLTIEQVDFFKNDAILSEKLGLIPVCN